MLYRNVKFGRIGGARGVMTLAFAIHVYRVGAGLAGFVSQVLQYDWSSFDGLDRDAVQRNRHLHSPPCASKLPPGHRCYMCVMADGAPQGLTWAARPPAGAAALGYQQVLKSAIPLIISWNKPKIGVLAAIHFMHE